MNVVSLETMARVVGLPYEPQLHRMFGDVAENKRAPHPIIGRAVQIVIDHMMDRKAFTGSSVSRVAEGECIEHSPALHEMQSFLNRPVDVLRGDYTDHAKAIEGMPQTVKTTYYEGAYKLHRMEKMSYFMLKIILSFGQNIDMHGYHTVGNFEGVHRKLMNILALANNTLVRGKPAVFTELEYYKRFKSIHFQMEGDTTGGINIMNFAPGFVDERVKMFSYQQDAQTGKLVWNDEGVGVEVGEARAEKKMTMLGQPRDVGEWLMYSARAIRTMVMEGGFDESSVDFESFLEKLPKNKEIGFESVVAIISNMIVAEKQNPELTKLFMDKLQLGKYFTGELSKRKPNRLAQRVYNVLGIDPERWNREALSHAMGMADQDIFVFSNEFMDRTSASEFRMKDFIPLIIKFLPIDYEELQDKIPAEPDRESITPLLAGLDAHSMRHNEDALVEQTMFGRGQWAKKMYLEAGTTFDEMRQMGEEQGWREDEVAVLKKARDYVIQHAFTGIKKKDYRFAQYLKKHSLRRYNRKTQRVEMPIGWVGDMPVFKERASKDDLVVG